MLFKIAKKNIIKSFRDYFIYFFTLVIGISLFYMFNAIGTQTSAAELKESQLMVVDFMNSSLGAVSVFVSMVLGALIIYANNFLIRRRKKEFGVYLTLGMSKQKLATMLFAETFLIGLISLVVGLLVGIFLSQFMSIQIAGLFEADMSKYRFSFSMGSMVKTVVYFGIMFFIVMIFNTFAVGKCRLINLLSGAKQNEKIKFRNPVVCIIIFVIAAFLLGTTYHSALVDFENMASPKDMLFFFAKGTIGTFGVFFSVSGLILTLSKLLKPVYYSKLNSFVLRQFSSKANTMVVSMSLICLMLFFTICTLSGSVAFAITKNNNLKEIRNADACMITRAGEGEVKSAEEILAGLGVDPAKDFEKFASGYIYEDPNLRCIENIGEGLSTRMQKITGVDIYSKETILTVSEYNKVAEIYGKPTFELADDEYIVSANYKAMITERNKVLKTGKTIKVNGITLKPKYSECQDGFLMMAENRSNYGNIIVPDCVVDSGMKKKCYMVCKYAGEGETFAKTEEYVNSLAGDRDLRANGVIFITKDRIRGNATGISAVATFVGMYLGLIFLMASAAVLALKELSESSDNVERYMVLRRIGVDEKMIHLSLFKQIGMFFSFPMILALLHSVFGILILMGVMTEIGSESMQTTILFVAGVILIVYGGYFILTYLASKRIIDNRR